MPIERQYTPAEAAEIARRHVVTIRIALEGGQLHGSQRVVGGRWTIAEECLAAFVRGEKCAHQATARPLRRVG